MIHTPKPSGTTEANKLVRSIHSRMAVILDTVRGQSWLDPTFTSLRTLSFDLRPLPSEMMEAHDVSPVVNSPENDVPECIQPYRILPRSVECAFSRT